MPWPYRLQIVVDQSVGRREFSTTSRQGVIKLGGAFNITATSAISVQSVGLLENKVHNAFSAEINDPPRGGCQKLGVKLIA